MEEFYYEEESIESTPATTPIFLEPLHQNLSTNQHRSNATYNITLEERKNTATTNRTPTPILNKSSSEEGKDPRLLEQCTRTRMRYNKIDIDRENANTNRETRHAVASQQSNDNHATTPLDISARVTREVETIPLTLAESTAIEAQN